MDNSELRSELEGKIKDATDALKVRIKEEVNALKWITALLVIILILILGYYVNQVIDLKLKVNILEVNQ